MNQVYQDLPGPQVRSENRRDHLRLRSREETRVNQVFQVHQVIEDTQGLLVPLVARKARRENQERLANEESKAKMVTLALQASLESKENQVYQVLQAGMERGALKVTEDSQVHQEW